MKKQTTITIEIEGESESPLVATVVLADPHDGTGLLDLRDITINKAVINTGRAVGTEVLRAVNHLQEALTNAIQADNG